MSRHLRPVLAGLVAAVAALAVAIGSATASSPHQTAKAAAVGVVQMVEGTFPQSLDPGLDYTTQGEEVNWLVYTGLTTYAHKSGTPGAQLIPGLATALPVISDSGKTYTATLRKGLVFSNGTPVVASDFTYTVERSLKIPWGGSGAFMTPYIVGAAAYANGKAKTISGITTDNATGKIVIHLTPAYGPFDNVLAFPSLGLIPSRLPDEGRGDLAAARRRSLQGDEHRRQHVVRGRPEPALGEDEHPRHPRRSRGRRGQGRTSNVTPTRWRC